MKQRDPTGCFAPHTYGDDCGDFNPALNGQQHPFPKSFIKKNPSNFLADDVKVAENKTANATNETIKPRAPAYKYGDEEWNRWAHQALLPNPPYDVNFTYPYPPAPPAEFITARGEDEEDNGIHGKPRAPAYAYGEHEKDIWSFQSPL
jgi:hypothetical protein